MAAEVVSPSVVNIERTHSLKSDGPASRAGLQEGDVIVAYGNTPVASIIDDLRRLLTEEKLGKGVERIIPGRGKKLEIDVVPNESAR